MAGNYRAKQIPVRIADVGTAENIYIPVTPGMEGRITNVYTVLGAAISSADSKVVISTQTGAGVAKETLGTITIANTSSAAGDVDYLAVGVTKGYVVAGDVIKIANGGESTGTAPGIAIVEVEV